DTEAEQVAWQHECEETRSMGDVPPAVSDGIVVTTAPITLPKDEYDEVHERHMIYALDAETGELLWEDDLGQGPTIQNNRSGAPMIDDGTVFVGSPITEASYAYDLQSGEHLWTYHTGGVKGAPVAQDDTVFFSTVGDRRSLDRSEEHTSELQSRFDLVCRLLLEKKKKKTRD